MIIIKCAHDAEVAADCSRGVKICLHANSAPHQRLRCKALLHARSQREIGFDFVLALAQFQVRFEHL